MKKRVILIGGGHGLSNLVKGFKNENIDLTIVVSSSDDGGHTGLLRDEFNVVALGDLRMVLNELIDDKSSLKEVFNHRFDFIHGIKKVSLGNLVLMSLYEKYGDIDKVIEYFKNRENISSNIYLSSNNSILLCAQCSDGTIVKKEHIIGESNLSIEKLYCENEAVCNLSMIEKIKNADIIVLGPGSLYTSVGSVVCIDAIKEAINNSSASIVYVCNIMCQDGETLNYSVKDHEEALIKIIGKQIDRVIVNNGKIPMDIMERYKKENSDIVICSEKKENYEFYDLVAIMDNKVMHNSELTAKIILNNNGQS